jgi:hypothetical protein
MDKRRLHHTWTKIRWLKPWYFLALALIATTLSVFVLRANNEHMVQLRSAVYEADKGNGDVANSLRNLQSYVTTHMNTNLSNGPNAVYPPIQLKYTYERLVQSQNSGLAGSQLYTEAQHYCEGKNSVDFSGRNRVPCIEKYVQAHGGAQPAAIPDALYKFDFVSPSWSPDLAGWSLLFAILLWLSFITSLLASLWFKRHTK